MNSDLTILIAIALSELRYESDLGQRMKVSQI